FALAHCPGWRRPGLRSGPDRQSGGGLRFRRLTGTTNQLKDRHAGGFDLVAGRGPHAVEEALSGLPPRLDRHGRLIRTMCFSAAASFSAAGLLGLAGIGTLAQVRKRIELPLAVTPLLFAAQQAIEGVLWLTVNQGRAHSLTLANLFAAIA